MRHLVAGIFAAILVMAAFVVLTPGVRAQRDGGMVDNVVWFEQPNQAQALIDLEAGTMDMYMFQLRTAADILSAKSNPNLWTIDTGGSLNNVFFNPVSVNQSLAPGKFNPFEFREVREAMNYIIDRDFISREISGGALFPHITLWHRNMPEYGRDAVFFSELERKYAFNPSLGKSIIFNRLATVPNLVFTSGHWEYAGAPVVLNFVIRTEDIRRDIGNYIATQIENVLGFSVTRDYKTGGAAFAIVYNGPPDTGAWALYTEGWANTALVAWADTDPFFFYDGGEGSRIWTVYRPEPELADVAETLFNSAYTSLAERKTLIEQAADLSIKNSVRLWVTAGATFAASNRVSALVYDLSGGFWGLMAVRTARFASAPTGGGTLNVGQRLQFLSPWNPWQGFGWLYDALQAYAFTDVPTFPHPHTGLYIPIRTDFAVYTPGPAGGISVPSGAQVWDNTTMGFKPVAAGTTAISVVNWTLTGGSWHDGEPFNMNDILYELALVYRRAHADGDIQAKDSDAALSGSILLSQVLKGFQVTGTNTISFYIDFWHPDPSTIESIANPAFPITPWTASELSLATVFDDTCRVSEVTASIEAREALDMTKGPCLAQMDADIGAYVSGNHEPPGLAAAFSDTETTARWTSLQAFRAANGHFFASNGPYILTNVDPAGPTSQMASDPNYPFPANRWDALLTPRVPQISFGAAPQVIPGLAASFTINSRLQGAPYDQLTLSYLVVDPSTGAVLYQGTPTRTAAGTYTVTLTDTQTGTLAPGAYDLRTVAVGDEAAVPVVSSLSFTAIPVLAYVQIILATEAATRAADDAALQGQLANQTAAINNANAAVASLQTTVLVAVALAIVALVVAVVVVVVGMRRMPRTGGEKPPEQM